MMFLCLVSVVASATDYYVSSSGNDSANGLSSSTPWQTISKVNSAFSGFNPGDRILLREEMSLMEHSEYQDRDHREAPLQ